MAIEAITGKVGSGKTLKAVSDMAGHVFQGGCICTNVELDRDKLAHQCWRRGRRFHDSQYILLPMETDPCFHRYMRQAAPTNRLNVQVYIDEAHLFFPASEYRDLKKSFLSVESFVSQSRRVRCDIFFITQAWDNVWGQLRKQALFVVDCRDFRVINLPMFGKSLGNAIGMKWSRKDAATGVVLETGGTALSKAVFDLYSTHQAYNEEMAEIMRTMAVFHEQHDRVPFFQRYFSKPPVTVQSQATTYELD
jgi:hypothetical protein